MTERPEGRWLTAAQVAERHEVSSETILRWAKAGKIPSQLTPSGRRRFRLEDVDARFADEAAEPGPEAA